MLWIQTSIPWNRNTSNAIVSTWSAPSIFGYYSSTTLCLTKKARDSSDPIFLFISLRPISSFTHLKWKQIVTKSHIAVPWVHSPHPQISIRHWRPFVQYSDPPRTTPWGGFLVVWWCPGLEERKKGWRHWRPELKQANVLEILWQKLSRHVRFFRHVCARRISAFKDVNEKVYLTNHQSRNGYRNKTTRNSWCDHLLCWYLTHLIHISQQTLSIMKIDSRSCPAVGGGIHVALGDWPNMAPNMECPNLYWPRKVLRITVDGRNPKQPPRMFKTL